MFTVIQSNDTDILADELTTFYQTHPQGVFDEFVVITPARVLDDWLKKTIANKIGISTLITTQFWGQYQWQMIKKVLDIDSTLNPKKSALKVPEVAVLSQSVIRWQIFAYLTSHDTTKTSFTQSIADDNSHPLYFLIEPIIDKDSNQNNNQKIQLSTKKLWQLSHNLARVFVLYLTQRDDWLIAWSYNKKIDTQKLLQEKQEFEDIYQKYAHDNNFSNDLNTNTKNKNSNSKNNKNGNQIDNSIDDWLFDYYQKLESALRFLWYHLFKDVFQYRKKLEKAFWQCLDDDNYRKNFTSILPKKIYLFTIQQIPQIELDFLKRLSAYIDVYLLHFNPSMMFWADIVDKTWLMQQQIINVKSVYLKDYGHGLLSRLGKSSRESFAMLAELSGGDDFDNFQFIWQDKFNELNDNNTLLTHLKKDILQLQEKQTKQDIIAINETALDYIKYKTYDPKINTPPLAFDKQDTSIMIHSCHSLKRQLEISRLYITKWLNQKNDDGTIRHLSDIVIFLPDIDSSASLIEVVYPNGVGIDGFDLPAKITGVSNKDTQALFLAISGFYTLSQDILYANDFFEWLLNPSLYQSIGLTINNVYRAIDLLKQAGFIQGLDESQLKKYLHHTDKDYRHTLSASLDKLVIGMIYGNTDNFYQGFKDDYALAYYSELFYPTDSLDIRKTPSININNDDNLIIQKLCLLYQAIYHHKDDYNTQKPMIDWLFLIENNIIKQYFDRYKDTETLRSIFDVINNMKSSIKANRFYHQDSDIQLSLAFVLESIGEAVKTQQISSEPASAITFGRFGSLRSINFGLVIMLDMNIGVFPRSESVNRLDLAKGFLRRRGDLVSEDDDNGAFLDAILCAKQSCWIFYTGQAIDSDVPLLPASPVAQLLRYFKEFIWQESVDENFDSYFIVKHSALPFGDDIFYQTDDINTANRYDIPPPMLWQMVHHNIQDKKSHILYQPIDYKNNNSYDYFLEVLLGDDKITDLPNSIDLSDIVNAVQKQAKHFLKDKVKVIDIKNDIDKKIPLSIDTLKKYQANDLLLQSTNKLKENIQEDYIDDIVKHSDLMPAGAMQYLAYENIKTDFLNIQDNFYQNMYNIGIENYTPTLFDKGEIILSVATKKGMQKVKITGILPVIDTVIKNNHTVVYIKSSGLSEKNKIELFLKHIFWQILLGDKGNYKTFGQFKDKFIVFDTVPKQQAIDILKKWLLFYVLSKTYITAVTPSNLYDSLSNNKKFIKWFDTYSDNKDYTSEECACHVFWQYILGNDGSILLELSLPIIDVLASDLMTYEITNILQSNKSSKNKEEKNDFNT